MTRKVCVVVTARPSYARVRSVLDALMRRGDTELQLVVGGSALLFTYGEAIKEIKREFPVAAEVWGTVHGQNNPAMAATLGVSVIELAQVFAGLKPDVVVTIADRYETLATAAAAAYLHIPLAHIQGGELSGSIDEKVRHAVTKLADLHFAATAKSKDRIAQMGEHPDRVWNTGCPSIDIAKEALRSNYRKYNPFEQYGGTGSAIDLTQPYLVVLQHSVTTHADEARHEMVSTLLAVRETGRQAFIFWPNVDSGSDFVSKALREYREQVHPSSWHFFRHLEAPDFLSLLLGAEALVGNSSVGIRECSYLGVPVVNIGDRQRDRERGPNVVDVPPDHERIREALLAWQWLPRPERSMLYGNGDAGEHIAELLATAPLSVEKRFS